MFGSKRNKKRNHTSDFFLANMEEAYFAHKKPAPEKSAEAQAPSPKKEEKLPLPKAGAKKMQKKIRRAMRDLKKEPTPEVKTEPAPEGKPEPAPEVKTEPAPEGKPEPAPEVKPEPTPEVKPEPASEVKPEPTPEVKTEPTPEVKPEPAPEVKPEPAPEVKKAPVPAAKKNPAAKAAGGEAQKKVDFRLKTSDPKSSARKGQPLRSAPLSDNPENRAMGEMVKKSLDGMYEVYDDPAKAKKNSLSRSDLIRYGILFVCIFGFLFAGAFVFTKIYDYYRIWAVNTKLQELIAEEDYFQNEYLKKTSPNIISLTPQDILSGKTEDQENQSSTFTEEQQNLVGKITQLKAINPDTAGWITIKGTVVNYPVVWSETKNYYLRRDFYKKVLSGGTLFIDERNSPLVEENRNTVIYGHNMTDGSMFASLHDFASSSVFYGATIQIATENGIFIYEPFSAHESNAYDNYFETDFVSDEDFINFCEQMQFISLFQTDHTFDKNSQIITLSTCASGSSNKDDRFAVHAVLTRVIR